MKTSTIAIILLSILAISQIGLATFYFIQNGELRSYIEEKSNENADLKLKISDADKSAQNMEKIYRSCNAQLTESNSLYNSCNYSERQLQYNYNSCQTELSSLKNSQGYKYSTKIYANDETIKKQSVQNLKNFELGTEFFSYNYKDGMEAYYAKAVMANYYYVRDNIEYTLSNTWNINPQTSLQTLNYKAGNCNEMSTLMASLMLSSGVKSRTVVLPDINHMILAITYEGIENQNYNNIIKNEGTTYLLLDATCKDCKFDELPSMDIGQNYYLLDYYEVNK